MQPDTTPPQTLTLAATIEAVLFFRAEPLSLAELGKLTGAKTDAITAALAELRTSLAGRGIALVEAGDRYSLGTAPEAAALIEKLTKEELSRDIGKAGMETLSIILYRGPITRREIDFIRGVNSTFIIRNLMIRGLVERVDDKEDKRLFRYRATPELMSFMGLRSVEDLPEFAAVREELRAIEERRETAEESAPAAPEPSKPSDVPPTQPTDAPGTEPTTPTPVTPDTTPTEPPAA